MRVLIAENNLANRLVARSILERESHHVTLVANGAEAIEHAKTDVFDVVLLDIFMPVMNGLEAVRHLISLPSNASASIRPYIFALTAYDTQDDINRYQAAGFDGVIAKPLRIGDLYASLAIVKCSGAPTLTRIAANDTDTASRPLLDEAIIRDGPGLADDVTRERIWRSYRDGLSSALRDISMSLPGCLQRDATDTEQFQAALHALRSASLTVGMDRAPQIARELRAMPVDELTDGVAKLLHAVRDSLPVLEAVLVDVSRHSVATRQLGSRM